MAPIATRSADAMRGGVSAPRHWRCLGRRQLRLLGAGPTLALVVLELCVIVLFGWLAGPFTILGTDGLDAHEADALPMPRVVVPAQPQSGHHPSQGALATAPAPVHVEDVGFVVRFRDASSPSWAGQTQADLSAASPVAGPARPSVRQGASGRPDAVRASAAGQPGAQVSHVGLAHPQGALLGTRSRGQATLGTTALRPALRDSRPRAAAQHHSRASRPVGQGQSDRVHRRATPLVHEPSG